MELTEKEKILIQLLGAYGYRKDAAIFVSMFLIQEKKFQDILADALTEKRLSEEELLRLMADYIKKEHPKDGTIQ